MLSTPLVQRAVNGRLTEADFKLIRNGGDMDEADAWEEAAFHMLWDDHLREQQHTPNKRLIGGGSRENDIVLFGDVTAAAAAGATTQYFPIARALQWRGWVWIYHSTEPNADNTLDFVIDYGVSASFTALFTNGNANGLLDTGAILTPFTNMGNAASGGATAIAVTPTVTRVAAGQTLRQAPTTAGTGTVPALRLSSYGVYM